MLFRMFNIELEYLPESAKCSEREHFLESNVRHNPLLSLMSRVSAELTFPRVTHLTFSSPQAPSSLWFSPPRALAEEGGCCTLSTVFFQIHPESRDSCSGKQASKSQPGPAAGRQSWILDHDEWMTFLGEQSHSRMITITPSHSVASVWLQSAVNAAYSAAGISNLIYCNVSIVLALVCSSHLLTLHPRGWIFHIVSWTAAISRGRRSYYNF